MTQKIRFIDARYFDLFYLPDGSRIIEKSMDGLNEKKRCYYIDPYHAKIGERIFHIHEYAKQMEESAVLYVPEKPQADDRLDYYSIYQMQNRLRVDYAFCTYAEAKDRINPENYRMVYQAVLAQNMNQEDIYWIHNRENRPFKDKIRPLSLGDIILFHRKGHHIAYYVDMAGYPEIPGFSFKIEKMECKRKKEENQHVRGCD